MKPVSNATYKRLLSEAPKQRDSTYRTHRGLNDYLEELPKHFGTSFTDVIEEKLKIQDQVSVLDIGCGEGTACHELKHEYPKVKVVGFSYDRYYTDKLDLLSTQATPHTTGDSGKLYHSTDGILYAYGDFMRIKEDFPMLKGFDVVMSLHAFNWMADPMKALQIAYSLCQSWDLIGLLDSYGFICNLGLVDSVDEAFFSRLNSVGYDFDFKQEIDVFSRMNELSFHVPAYQFPWGRSPELMFPFRVTPYIKKDSRHLSYHVDELEKPPKLIGEKPYEGCKTKEERRVFEGCVTPDRLEDLRRWRNITAMAERERQMSGFR